MSASFSGHLINAYSASFAPFGQQASQITTCGPMSYNPAMHGSFGPPSFSFNEANQSMSSDISEATALKIAELQAKLDRKLGPEYISQRPGPGGGPKLTYAEGWKIINLANEVFGFNGWSSSIVSLTTDFIDFSEETRRFTVGVTCVMRVTLRDGVFHEDVGYGMLENSKSKGAALDKCKKEAVTDGIKRALRNFGNLLGNCLYDKTYTSEIVKVKVPPPKFDKATLHRRPEYADTNLNTSMTNLPPGPNQASTLGSNQPMTGNTNSGKPLSSVPPHMRGASSVLVANANEKFSSVSGANTSANPNSVRGTVPGVSSNTSIRPPLQQQSHAAVPLGQKNIVEPASPISAGDDDSFTFPSDDDAFLAAIDMELDADLGRPILEGEGVGGAVHFDEAGSRNSDRSVVDGTSAGSRMYADPTTDGAINQRHAQTSAPALPNGLDPAPTKIQDLRGQPAASSTPHNPQRAASTSTTGAINKSGRSTDANASARRIELIQELQRQEQQSTRTTASAGDGTHSNRQSNPPVHSTSASGSAGPTNKQNENTGQLAGGATSTGRSPAPSMGGFHFPPGVNPNTIRTGSVGTPLGPGGAYSAVPASASVVGIKRNADMMNNGPLKRPVQGMGLAQQQGGPNRQPFAQLEMDQGGGVKRFKK